jgi:alpha-D-xyloside xylohydrolase
VPWAFDDEAVEVARKFTRLKMSLMPYLARAAQQVQESGTPILRPMVLEFPDDPATEHLDTQYMLGDSLLVAPVFEAGGQVRFYVPDGEWTHLLDGHTVIGPRWVTERYGFDSVPIFVRPGTVLPVGAHNDKPDYDYADGVTLRLFGEPTSTTVRIPALGGGPGTSFDVTADGATVIVDRTEGPAQPWSVLQPEGARATAQTGGEPIQALTANGFSLRAGSATVTITMS